MMELVIVILTMVANAISVAVGIMLITAIIKIHRIDATLAAILRKVTELGALNVEIDKHRREEFNALTEGRQ